MAPSRKIKVIGGTAVALVAFGASTGLAKSGATTTQIDLADVVPVSQVSAPAPSLLDQADISVQIEAQDSVASPFDIAVETESVASVETVQSVDTTDDSVDSPDSPDSVDSSDSPDSPDSVDSTD